MNSERINSKKRLGFSVFLNSAITISEVVVGVLSGSLALLSDAGHNFSDVLSLILGYFGASFSEKKPTETHTFGYKRVEVLTSLVNASALLVIGTYVVYEAYNRLQNPPPIQPVLVIVVATVALAGNLGSIFILRGDEEKSLNVRAVMLHLAMDSLASIGVVVSGLIIYFYRLYIADVIISLIIGGFIFYSAYKVLKEGFHIMMQGSPLDIELEEVKEYLEEFDEISSIHDLHIWSLSSTQKIISCHICLSSSEINKDELIKRVEKGLIEKFGFEHITIQIEENRVCETGNHSPSDVV